MRSISHGEFNTGSGVVSSRERRRQRASNQTSNDANSEKLFLRWAVIGFSLAFWIGVGSLIF